MSIFRTALRIVAAHRAYVLVYLILLSMLGLFMGLANGVSNSETVTDPKPVVAVVDRDGSQLSHAVADYLSTVGEMTEIDDSARALQDAAAEDRIQYVLVIPEGFQHDFEEAVASGTDAPSLDSVVSYRSGAAMLMNTRTTSFLGQVYTYLGTTAHDVEEAVTLADDTMADRAETELIPADTTPLSNSLTIYLQFSTYPLFAFIVVAISMFMDKLNRRAIRGRTLGSPVPSFSRSTQIFSACLLIGLIGWFWICLLGLAVFGGDMEASSWPLLAVAGAAMLAYALCAVAIGFLLGQAGLKDNAVNAVANILGMVLSFLGGAWISLEFMPDAVVKIAHFTPSYWTNSMITGAAHADSASMQTIAPLMGDCGIALLFALAIFLVAVAIGRARNANA